MTAMYGKGAESYRSLLGDLVINAVLQVTEEKTVDQDHIKIEKKVGDSVESSELIQGIVLDKERVHSNMPKKVLLAKIALLDCALEIKTTETDAKIQITEPGQMQAFLDQEEFLLKKMADDIISVGATVVFCQKGIDDLVQHFLAKQGVYACRRVKKSDMENLARATGAKMVSSLKELTSQDLGKAGVVEEYKTGDESMTYVQQCQNPKAVTLLLRGGTAHVVAEIERAVKDALGDVIASLKEGKVVAGAGSVEIELAKRLREFATSLSGREQLAVNAFADAIEVIPATLAENAGLDPIDLLTELKSRHDKGEKWAGLDVYQNKVVDAWKADVIEPLKIKTQAIKSASEVAEMILRIDDVIAAGNLSKGPMPNMADM